MVMAIFVLVLLTTTGVALLFISGNELKMSRADVASKQVFFMSEGGLEDGRNQLFVINKASAQPRELDDELDGAAGVNNTVDFDPATLRPVYNSSGLVTGFTGYGDDVPVKPMTAFAGGWYVAFMQNDVASGAPEAMLDDENDRVLLTAMAADRNNHVELVRALVEREDTFAIPPATITVLGENSTFEGGNSNSKEYIGNDFGSHCPPGTSGNVPVVGMIGSAAEAQAVGTINSFREDNYYSGSDTGAGTIDDLTTDPNLPELWTNCELLVELADIVRGSADLVGNTSTPRASLGTPSTPKAVYINGDYTVSGNFTGAGLLFVTGHLEMDGQASWQGPIFAIGVGEFERNGAGNGVISGGVIVADVAGPDRILFTADDCSGEDGVHNTADDGVAEGSFFSDGTGTSQTGYCSAYFNQWQSMRPFKLLSFVQE
jgi:hypothetical protein